MPLVKHQVLPRAITREYLEGKEARAVASRIRRERIGHNLARLLVLGVFLGIWQSVAALHDVTLLPGPVDTYLALRRAWPIISSGAVETMVEIALGFAIGGASGIILGSLIGQSVILQGILHPYLILYQAVPKTGLAPVIVLILGFGLTPKVTLAAMTSVFPVLENTIIGVQRVDEDSLRLFRGLGASSLQVFLKLRLINALPLIMTGIRVGVVLATVSVVVAEFVAGRVGLGAVMMVGYAQLDTPLVFAALFILSVVGVAYYFAALLLEAAVLGWFNLRPIE